MSRDTYTKDQVLKAIEGSGGIVSAVAQRLGCAWKTADNLVKRWAEVREAFMAEREKVLDIAETTLIKSIQNGDTQDAKWMLSKRGKARGYGDALDLTSDGKRIVVNWRMIEGTQDDSDA